MIGLKMDEQRVVDVFYTEEKLIESQDSGLWHRFYLLMESIQKRISVI
jgi:hypothetical protein